MYVCWGVPVFPPSCTVAEPEACRPSRSLPICNSSLHELRLGIPAQEWDEKEGAIVCPWCRRTVFALVYVPRYGPFRAHRPKRPPIQSLSFHSHLSIIQSLTPYAQLKMVTGDRSLGRGPPWEGFVSIGALAPWIRALSAWG